jgi:hypothetical protein
VDEFYRVRHIRLKPCKCDLEEQGLWFYASDLYRDRYFYTPAQHKPFRVTTVMEEGLEVVAKNKKYFVARTVIEPILECARINKEIYRTSMESRGIRNSSQIINLLSLLTELRCALNPMKLLDKSNHQSYISP